MTKHEVFKKFVTETDLTIPRFTGTDDGLEFLDRPEAFANAPVVDVESARCRAIEIAEQISSEHTQGIKLGSIVARIAGNNGDSDAEYIATIISDDPQYVREDLLADN